MKKRRRVRPFVWLGAFVVASMGTSDVTAKKPGADRRIAVLLDGPVEGIDKVVALAREELASFGHSSPSLLSKRLTKVGDFTLKTARQQLDRALADPKVDIVWAFGVIASAAAVQRATSGRLKKPVVAPFVLAPGAEALKKLDGRTSNLSYVVLTPALSRDLKALRTLQPIDHLAYLLSPSIRQALPDIETALKANAQALGVKLHIASDSDPQRLVDGLPADIDAVYVGLDPHQTEDDLKTLVSALIARRLPSFAQGGRAGVELGLLMGLSGPENAMRLARAVAVNTDAILQGEAPGALNYAFRRVENLVVNAATAKAIGRSLPWAVLSEAELLGDDRAKTARKISLEAVVTEVRDQNLELRANREDLIARQESVRESVGAFLPALDASLSGSWNDPDGATGLSPERSLSWSGSASQVVLNEPAMAQVTINKHLRDATRFDNRTAVLDTVRSASVGYLNVLRARVTEKIQRDNLKVTRTELAQARLRQEVGSGSRSEVVRLENQLATNRRNVIDAVASRNVNEIELLRLLNRASEDRFIPEDVSLESSKLMNNGQRLQSYMTGPDRFAILRRFIALEAINNAPELKAGASRLAAQQREALSRKLTPFLPQISISGSVTHQFATAGEGTSEDAQAFFPLNEFSWQVGVTASLSLWEGNARYARIAQEQAEARSQDLDLQARRIRIEADVRTALHQAGASYAAIGLQRDAADAANENLTLVGESYGRGKADIITLVDAQNQALTGQLDANTAVYDFLVDLLEVQRSMGRFDFWMSESEVDDFFQRLSVFATLAHDKSAQQAPQGNETARDSLTTETATENDRD